MALSTEEIKIIDMLSDIIKTLDYDLWKEYFVYEDEDDITVLEMIEVVKKHLKHKEET